MKDIVEKYVNSREKINSELFNQLRTNTTDLSDNPAIPQKDALGNPINFLEMVAYKRFLEVVERVKRNTGIQDISGQSGFMQLQRILSESAFKIFDIESTQINYLEKLSVDLVVEEMKIPDGAFQFDCKIVPFGSVSKDGFQNEAQNPSENEIKKTFGQESSENEMTPNELFELEKHKRRFINLLIQGSSKKGHYMYLMVQDKLNNINPELSSLYGKMMSINDLTYWILPDEMIKMIASSSSSMAGKEEIDETTNPPTIKTQAICFPVSIHEIIKGIMEVFGTQGLPDEPQMAQMIIDSVDSLANETTDLRLGVGIWEIFYNCYPSFVFEDEYKHIQHYMFARFCALEIEEFFKVSRMILSDETRGKKYMLDLANEIKSDLQKREYNNNFGNDYDEEITFNYGGYADDMTMVGRAIEYLTGTAIERDSIVDKGFKYEFRYKGKTIVTSIDSKLVRDTIYSNKKSLAGRYSDGGEAGFNDAGTSMVMYHEKQGNWLVPKGQVYLYLYDVEDSASKLGNEFDWVFYPLTSQMMAFQRDYIPPLKKIWTKKFQKEHKGSEHLLGVIKAFLIDKDGKQELYIDMMSVNPNKKKKGIMSYMIKDLRDSFNLSQEEVTFSKLTPEGEKFVAKKTYDDGGETSGLITDEQVKDLSFKIKIKNVPLKKGVLLHQIITLEEFDLPDEENVNFYPFHLIYGDSSLAIFDAFGVDEVAGLKRKECEEFINNLKAEGKTEKDDSFIAGLTNYVGDKLFMFFNVERLSYEGFANRVLPHEALHLSRNLISLFKNKWLSKNLNTPNWWEDKRASFVDMDSENEEFFAETLERTTAIAMDGWFKVTGQKCIIDKNKPYEGGGLDK